MSSSRPHYAALTAIGVWWIILVMDILGLLFIEARNLFPRPVVNEFILAELTVSSILFSLLLVKQAHLEGVNESRVEFNHKCIPFLLLFVFFTPFVYGYVFDSGYSSIGQLILDGGTELMAENFDDLPLGTVPPGWESLDGNWTTVSDDGNIVYYQEDNADKEALSISSSGNSSWVDYTYEVDLKFVEGNTKKDDRGALVLFRYQGGNSYYFLWMKEGLDVLELHSHGDGAHMVASVNCFLVPDVWYHVNVTIVGQSAWVSIDDVDYFSGFNIDGAFDTGSAAIGTSYYKVMFDNILVEPK